MPIDQTTQRRDLPTFPASVIDARRLKRRGWMRRIATLLVVALVAGGAGLLWSRRETGGTARYRTTTAQPRQIDSVLTSVATIEPVTQASVGFPTSGTVTSVDVAVGDTVAAGTVLATLDTAELEQSLRQKQDDLATAELALSIALDGDDPSSVTGGMSGQPVAASGSSDGVTVQLAAYVDVVRPAVDQGALSSAQQAVLDAQSAVSSATATASAALQNAIGVCSAVGVEIVPSVDPNDPTAPITIPTGTVVACQSELNNVISAQQAVTDAQNRLASASSALNSLLGSWSDELATATTAPPATDPATTTPPATDPATDPATTTPPATDPATDPATTTPATDPATTDPGSTSTTTTDTAATTTTPASPGTTPEGPDGAETEGSLPDGGDGTGMSGAGGSMGSSGSTGRTPTAEDLVAYQAAVDAAKVQVQVAEQSIAQATIVSPVAGTVTAVGIGAGDSVEAGSDTQTVTIESADGYEATTTIGIDDIADVAVGDAARVTADGTGTVIDGQVVAIAIVPESSSTNFRVTIGLNDDTSALHNGNIGTAELVTDSVDASVAVPNSALSPNGERSTVTVLGLDGQAVETVVQVGVVGTTWTEITGGLSAGDTVVLADYDAAITNDEISTNNGLPDFARAFGA